VFARDRRVVKPFMDGRTPGPDALAEATGLLSAGSEQDGGVARRELHKLFERVVAHPESEACRTINAMNKVFRAKVAPVPGALEVLVAAGFELRLVVETSDSGVETKSVVYFWPEPDLASDMDGWTAWFDFVKTVPEALVD